MEMACTLLEISELDECSSWSRNVPDCTVCFRQS